MISSERSQNIIISFVIIVALVSSVLLINNVNYYSGSYVLAERVDVNMVKIVVSDINPANESIYPHLSFTFNFRTDSPTKGNVRLSSIEAAVTLNDDPLSLTTFDKSLTNDPNQFLHPGYNANFTLGKTINSDPDRATVLLADNISTWNWYLRLRFNIIMFDEGQSLRTLYFNWTGPTTVIRI
jgi:hypothetical protein